jgi:Flp pilus assembly protein TadD
LLSAQVQLAAGQADQGERILRDIVAADAAQLEAYDLLGRIYAASGQIDRALAEYRSLAARLPAPAPVFTMIGLLEDARGDQAAARAGYEKALAADPAAATAANNLAWIYAEEGRLDEASARDECRTGAPTPAGGCRHTRLGVLPQRFFRPRD